MKIRKIFLISGMLILFLSGTAFAGSQADVQENTPAILASLDKTSVTVLDDTSLADIRGQAQYTMVKVLGINTWDYTRCGEIEWTLNPLGYRYGNWGGPNYTNKGAPVDEMDYLFMMHDNGASDEWLFAGLAALKTQEGASTYTRVWGRIYTGDKSNPVDPNHFNYKVAVCRTSWMSSGGRFIFGWRDMPLTEYARREAVIGIGILVVLQ